MNKTKTNKTKTAMDIYLEASDSRRIAQKAFEDARAAFDNATRLLRAAKATEAAAAEAAYKEVNPAA